MKVYFIGAGPGDPDLITVKGRNLIERCPAIMFTGSLVPERLLECRHPEAKVWNSAGMTLDEIIAIIKEEIDAGREFARVHTGDPSIYGSTAEQMRKLDELGIPYEVIPGVSSFSAAAAALKQELTLPEVSQTVVITRAEGRTPMPEKEELVAYAKTGATLVLFLSITLLRKVVRTVKDHYGEDCPISIVHKASHPDEVIVRGTLADIVGKVTAARITSQSIIIIGRVIDNHHFPDSRLYAADFSHGYRDAQTV